VSLQVAPLTSTIEPRLRELIGNVLRRHGVVDAYRPDLLTRAAVLLGDDFGLLVARRGGMPVGCAALLRSGSTLLPKWLGLDYQQTLGTYTYHALLTEVVARAFDLGVDRIMLGPTVPELKRDVGARLEDRSVAWRLRSPLLTRLVSRRLAGRRLETVASG
jgi:hypothetical protein